MAKADDRLRRLLSDELGECCEADVESQLDDLASLEDDVATGQASEHVSVLSALANDTRYRIVQLLAAADSDLCVCELTPLLDVSDSAISHALSELNDAGLVERRKDGRWRHYRATDQAERLLAALAGENSEREAEA